MVDWNEERASLFTPRNLSTEDNFGQNYIQTSLYEALQLCTTSAAYKKYFTGSEKSIKRKKQAKHKENTQLRQRQKTLKLVYGRDSLAALDLATLYPVSIHRMNHGKMDYPYLGDTLFRNSKSNDQGCRDQVPQSPTCMSDSSTVFSDDYTEMTDLGEGSDLYVRSPSGSASGGDCDSTLEPSDRSSISSVCSDLERVTLDFSNDASDKQENVENTTQKDNVAVQLDNRLGQESGDAKADFHALLTQGFTKLITTSLSSDDSKVGKGRTNSVDFYEDSEFDFLKSEPVKRSTSLKTNKTPPGTPGRKKVVRFADALGLDLEDVRHVLNSQDPPQIPASAMKDLKVGLEEDHKTDGTRYLSACFPQPSASPTFVQRVRDEKVVLENCIISDSDLTITGTVRVANISYNKQVVIRYTVNNWTTFTDVQASYVINSNDGATDRFSFSINVPSYFAEGSKLQFAIMYRVNGQEFWDSNTGRNYVIECYAKAVPVTDSDNTWLHFI